MLKEGSGDYSSCSMGIRGGDTCGAESWAMRFPILRMRFATSSRLRFAFLRIEVALLFDWLGPVGSEVVVSAGVCSAAFAAGSIGVASGVDLKLEPKA